ncbi:MAG: O-antigen ligase family protein [Thermodesulfovibrionales bacterium]
MTDKENTYKAGADAVPYLKGKVRLKSFVYFPAIFWIMLWLSINTGPWVLRSEPEDITEWMHWARTLFQPLILLSSMFFLMLRHDRVKLPGNARLWLHYGLIGLLASLLSPEPLDAAYWAIAYLSAFTAMMLYLREGELLKTALQLNYLTWVITLVFLSILVFVARDSLFIGSDAGLTGYGIEARMPTVVQMPMSRSSGMARFAAVPGIISFVLFWRAPKWQRIGWGGLFFYSAALIYLMQSRGAIFGLAFSLAFVMILLGKRTRVIGMILMVIFGAGLFADIFPKEIVDQVSEHLGRHQNREEIMSLTGRTRAWEQGMKVFWDSPIIGWGFQADRMLIKEHVHNTYLYALLTSGLVGGTLFLLGLVWTWGMFYRVLRSDTAERLNQKVPFIICGGILAFFTVRSIPEVSGSLFGVDFLIMLPAVAYIGILDAQRGDGPAHVTIWNRVKIRW